MADIGIELGCAEYPAFDNVFDVGVDAPLKTIERLRFSHIAPNRVQN